MSTLMIFSHLCSQAVSSVQVFRCELKNSASISLSLICHPNSMCDEYKLWASHYTASVDFDLAVWISLVSYLVDSILAPYSSDDWGSRFLHNVGDHLQYNAVLSYKPEGGDLNFHISVCSLYSFQLFPPSPDILYAPCLQHPFRLFFRHGEKPDFMPVQNNRWNNI
jgi:hypothetical protein